MLLRVVFCVCVHAMKSVQIYECYLGLRTMKSVQVHRDCLEWHVCARTEKCTSLLSIISGAMHAHYENVQAVHRYCLEWNVCARNEKCTSLLSII